MLRMAPPMAVKEITHVQQLFGDDDLKSMPFGSIDAREIDENCVCPGARQIDVRATQRRTYRASKPTCEGSALGRDLNVRGRQIEACRVFLKEDQCLIIVDPGHSHLRGLRSARQPWIRRATDVVCSDPVAPMTHSPVSGGKMASPYRMVAVKQSDDESLDIPTIEA